jgi:plastocyanin
MKALSVAAVVTAAVLALAGAAIGSRSSTPTLKGTVGPGYTVSLTKGGKKVTSLTAGTYKIVVSDKSNFHNSVLEREKPSKPKLEKDISGTGFTGTKTVTMTLKPGSWRFYCSVHESQMHQDFKVTK